MPVTLASQLPCHLTFQTNQALHSNQPFRISRYVQTELRSLKLLLGTKFQLHPKPLCPVGAAHRTLPTVTSKPSPKGIHPQVKDLKIIAEGPERGLPRIHRQVMAHTALSMKPLKAIQHLTEHRAVCLRGFAYPSRQRRPSPTEALVRPSPTVTCECLSPRRLRHGGSRRSCGRFRRAPSGRWSPRWC